MKAARLHAYHQPLKLDEIDEPQAVGPLDVVVRIGAAGLCPTDLHIQEGQWAGKAGVPLPWPPGRGRKVRPALAGPRFTAGDAVKKAVPVPGAGPLAVVIGSRPESSLTT